jgi:hypothetical protein
MIFAAGCQVVIEEKMNETVADRGRLQDACAFLNYRCLERHNPVGAAAGCDLLTLIVQVKRSQPRFTRQLLQVLQIQQVLQGRGQARSKIAAMPWPPPMHMVTSA